MPEIDLIKRCKRGDRDAFNELVTEYQTRVVNIAYGMLSDSDDALDAAQEVFIRVYRGIGEFQEKSSFTTWLYRITSNVCADALRKRQRSGKVVSISPGGGDDGSEAAMNLRDTAPTPEESVEITEQHKAVREAMKEIKDEYREVLTLFDVQGLSYKAISEILKVPEGTVKSRLNRARISLKKILSEKLELFE